MGTPSSVIDYTNNRVERGYISLLLDQDSYALMKVVCF